MANTSIGTAWIQIKPSMQGISKDIEKQLGNELSGALSDGSSKFSQFTAYGIDALGKIGKFGFTALAATATATMALIGSRISSAVNRVDTLLNFPRVLTAMGESSADSKASIDKLSKSLQGLPTSLQAGASGVQQLVVAGLKLPKATDAFLALNNALISSGAGAAQVDSAMLALSQSLSRGRIDGQEWNSLLATMPTAFSSLQKATGKSTLELKEMFQLNPAGLIDSIIKLNEEGGNGFKSLDDQAREATGGIGTAWANLGNAIDRGWQALLTAFGGGSLEVGAKRVSDIITGFGTNIENTMKSIGTWINNNGPLINNILIPAFKGIAVAIGLITIGFTIASIVAGGWVSAIVAGILIISAALSIIGSNWQYISDFIGQVFANIVGFAASAWQSIQDIFNGVAPWFTKIFQGAWDGIKTIFSQFSPFFRSMWDGIVSIFGLIGTSIGNAIGGSIKGVVNAIIGFAEGTINGFINAINIAIDVLNAIPGVNIGRLNLLNIPRLATGGPVFGPGSGTSDSIPAYLSNGEYVIKAATAQKIGYDNLDKLNSTGSIAGGGDTYFTINGYNKDPEELADIISRKIALKKGRVIGG